MKVIAPQNSEITTTEYRNHITVTTISDDLTLDQNPKTKYRHSHAHTHNQPTTYTKQVFNVVFYVDGRT